MMGYVKKIVITMYSLLARIIFMVAKVKYPLNSKFIGLPIVYKNSTSIISIGSGVKIVSANIGNPVGINHRTVIAAIGKKSSITIGEGSSISGSSIVAREKIIIGNDVLIGANCAIFDSDFHPIDSKFRKENVCEAVVSKAVYIEDSVWLGYGVTVLKGVTIGKGAVVAACSVVTKNVPPHTIYGGNPAKLISNMESKNDFS